MAFMEQNIYASSVVFVCDIDSTYKMTDGNGKTAAAGCGVVGPRDRRRIITIPPTRIVTLRCRPHINLIVGDGGERNPASEVPVSSRIFPPTGSPNLTSLCMNQTYFLFNSGHQQLQLAATSHTWKCLVS